MQKIVARRINEYKRDIIANDDFEAMNALTAMLSKARGKEQEDSPKKAAKKKTAKTSVLDEKISFVAETLIQNVKITKTKENSVGRAESTQMSHSTTNGGGSKKAVMSDLSQIVRKPKKQTNQRGSMVNNSVGNLASHKPPTNPKPTAGSSR